MMVRHSCCGIEGKRLTISIVTRVKLGGKVSVVNVLMREVELCI